MFPISSLPQLTYSYLPFCFRKLPDRTGHRRALWLFCFSVGIKACVSHEENTQILWKIKSACSSVSNASIVSILLRIKDKVTNHSPQGPSWRYPYLSYLNSPPFSRVSVSPTGLECPWRQETQILLFTAMSLEHCLQHSRLCFLVIPLSAGNK